MSGDCEFCGEHILDCHCDADNHDQIYGFFYMFLLDAFKEFHPNSDVTIGRIQKIEFVNQWVDKNFWGIE
jgi:hypothetical protein